MAILEEYASSVQMVGEDEVRMLMKEKVQEMRKEGKDVGAKDRPAVKRAVEECLGGRPVEGSVWGKVLQDISPSQKME